jgi:hypothetical protein
MEISGHGESFPVNDTLRASGKSDFGKVQSFIPNGRFTKGNGDFLLLEVCGVKCWGYVY